MPRQEEFLIIEIARLSENGNKAGMDVREIERGLKKPGKSKSGLAKALGREPPAVTGILKGTRKIKADEIPVIRKYLELAPVVPVRGSVGAGSETHFYALADDPEENVPAPAGASGDTVAVRIRGESLGAGFDGGLAFYDDRREPLTDDLLNRLCVVGLSNGQVLIKIPRKARQRGLFHLYPNNTGGEVILDVKIEWAARVILLAPKP